MPIRNEGKFIRHSLGALLEQDYPGEMEILIADGMSDDDTRKTIRDMNAHRPRTSTCVLENPGRIVPTGMNIALRQATGEIIIRVDGHTIVAPDYVRQCVDALERTGADNVGGKMNAVGENFFGKAVALATSTPFGVGNARFHYSDEEEWVDTVYMGAWHRNVFEKIGLFDEELVRNQDDEFNYRLRAAGGRVLLCPAVKSRYNVRSSPVGLMRQYFQYGFWKVRVLQKHPRQMSLRQFIPPGFVLALVSSALFIYYPLSFIPVIIPALYLAFILFASFYISMKDGWKFLPVLPLIFAILHLSYGFGFLAGLTKFWNRWRDRAGRAPSLQMPGD